MDFVTPELFNALIVGNMIIGVLLIGWRFRKDMTRPIAGRGRQDFNDYMQAVNADDTQPTRSQSSQQDNQP